MAQSETVAFLFTDLVNSTQQMQAVGDEAGQRLFRAHHKLMTAAVTACGGQELQWLGDGVLAVFASAGDAVRSAISVQQTASRPVAGARFEIRVGIHAGEAMRREGGYFGTPVVVTRRLCDRAEKGQILCSRLIAELLAERQAFSFRDLGDFQLKGIATPIGVCEVAYQRNDPAVLVNRTPFVGRLDLLDRLSVRLEEACNGRGAIAMLQGEAGIGKTRLIEEFTDLARQRGALVLRGACYDGEWQPPFGPFAEAIVDYARRAEPADLMQVIDGRASTLVRFAPALRQWVVGNLNEPAPLEKEEERFRLLDAVTQFMIALAQRTPMVLVLDDLHWADRGTAAMLQHVARFVGESPIFLLGAYRDAEVDARHALAPAVAAIRRLPNSERITLQGLDANAIAELLGLITDRDAPEELVKTIGSETEGNPFFIRELLLHLLERRKLQGNGEGWLSRLNLDELDIPAGVRELVTKRVSRLSNEANAFLNVGAAFKGAFPFEVAAAAAGLDEQTALGAADEALDAHLLRPAADPESFEFTHAIIRHTLYTGLNRLRRTRLHRKIAEAMEAAWGERATEHAAEVAYQFWRAGPAPETARGVRYAIAAAGNAEAAYAHDEAAAFLRIALELLPATDPQRTRLLARLGIALIWTPDREEAVRAAAEAGDLIARTEGADAAAEYFEGAAFAMFSARLRRDAWELARKGLRQAGARRDIVWAGLRELDLMLEAAEDSENPGIRMDTPAQRELGEILKSLPAEQVSARAFSLTFDSREEVIRNSRNPQSLLFLAGDYRGSLPLLRTAAADAERQGRIAWAAKEWADVAVSLIALGDFEEARAACDRAASLSARAAGSSQRSADLDLMNARHDLRIALDEGWEEAIQDAATSNLAFEPNAENHWVFAMICGCAAYVFARLNQPEMALPFLSRLPVALERGAPWEPTYDAIACDAAATLWSLARTDYLETIERNLREKVLKPDFRRPMRDGRLALARLCALRGSYDEAEDWFAKAREVLDDAGARPLRAIADHDEALMYLRRAQPGDSQHARPLFEAAGEQFHALAMNGWLHRIEEIVARS